MITAMRFLFSTLVLFALLMPSAPAKADIVNDIFRIECIPEIGVLSIRKYFDNGYLPDQALGKNADEISQKYGISMKAAFRKEKSCPLRSTRIRATSPILLKTATVLHKRRSGLKTPLFQNKHFTRLPNAITMKRRTWLQENAVPTNPACFDFPDVPHPETSALF